MMNPEEALLLLDKVCSQVSLSRLDHNRILEAIVSIRGALLELKQIKELPAKEEE